MTHVSSERAQTEGARPRKRSNLAASIALWIIQILLALLFLLAGLVKLLEPTVAATMAPVPLPGLLMQFIAVTELLAAVGLIFPGLLRILRRATPLAAIGLALEMAGGVAINLMERRTDWALFSLIVGLFCVAVAYGRRSWK